MNMLKMLKVYLGIIIVCFLLCMLNNFNPVSFVNILFVLGIMLMIVSGIYYLLKQNAFVIINVTFKKVIYAFVESFTSKDYSNKRKLLNESMYSDVNLKKNSEIFIVSIFAVITSIIISAFI